MRRASLLLLFAALAARAEGPHAREAAAHARDPDAAWVHAVPLEAPLVPTAPVVNKRVYGYLPYWQSFDNLAASIRWELLTDIIAFELDLATDGTVTNPHSLPGSALLTAAHSHGVKVHLCATRFNSAGGSEIATFLASPTARAKAVQQLVSFAAGVDGINLDFEFVPSGSRDAYTSFVQQLRAALGTGKELTLAIPATISYTGYDIAKLAAATDRLLLMEYDYHWRSAPTSGANAPLPSVTSAVNGFLNAAPAASFAMGVPYYGYDWATTTSSPGSTTTAPGAVEYLRDVFNDFATRGRLWDSASQTPWFRYAGHQGWCDDDQSLALKYALVKEKNLAGVMIWALGYDDGRTEAWDALQTAFGPAGTGEGKLQLVSATFTPPQLDPGQLVTAQLVVKNTGGQPLGTIAPPPSTLYDETQSSTGSIAGTYRVAVDVGDRPAAQQAHPWRWGLEAPLAAGAQATLTAQIRLERTGPRTLWAAVVHEGVDVPQDNVGTTLVQVGQPPPLDWDAGTDGGTDGGQIPVDPPLTPSRGCAEAPATLFALLGLLAGARRLRRNR